MHWKNITLNKLAIISGITQSTLNNIISGRNKSTTVSTIKKICDGLEISVLEFFSAEIFNDLEQEIVWQHFKIGSKTKTRHCVNSISRVQCNTVFFCYYLYLLDPKQYYNISSSVENEFYTEESMPKNLYQKCNFYGEIPVLRPEAIVTYCEFGRKRGFILKIIQEWFWWYP